MSDKIRLIYNKIENRIDEICDDGFVSKENQQEYETLTDLEDFIDSLPKEPASEDLIEEIDKIWKTCNPIDEGMGVETANIHIEQFDDIARHFAEWQKQKAFQDFLEKAEEFLYLQLNNGSIECGNIERLIDDLKNYMQKEEK